ncbi:MAG: chaperone modulator CbpM [Caldilineaceae bacterium]
MAQLRVRYALVRRHDAEPLYLPDVAAALAGVSRQALEQYRRAGLVRLQTRIGGIVGYSAAEIRRLVTIRRLREEVALDLGAIEVVLHLREQIFQLQQEVQKLHEEKQQREKELLETIHRLRQQLATEGNPRRE